MLKKGTGDFNRPVGSDDCLTMHIDPSALPVFIGFLLGIVSTRIECDSRKFFLHREVGPFRF